MLRATMMDFPLTLRHVVDRVETLFAHVPIVGRRPDGTLLRTTWGETMAFARRLAAALQRLGLRNRDVLLHAVPMFHVNGWGLPYTSALVGARLVLPGRHLDPVSLLELLAGEQVTVATGVTTIWLGVLEELTRHPERWPLRLRTILIGGTPVPEHLIRAFAERYGTEVLQCWGMTETSPLATAAYLPADLADAPLEDQVRYRAKHGRPPPFVEIRVRNVDGLVPWDGATMGELEVRGPLVAAA